MGLKIGGGRGGNIISPQNSGQSSRAANRLESLISAANVQRDAAIEVDPVNVFVWRKGNGSCVCSCSQRDPSNPTESVFSAQPVGESLQSEGYRPPMPGSSDRTLGGYQIERTRDERDIVNAASDADIGLEDQISPDSDADFDDVELPESDATSESGILDRALADGPFESGETTQCPVCFGASYTDAWKPFKGLRTLGDLTDNCKWESDGDLNTDANPNVLTLRAGQYLQWTLSLPKYFDDIMRVALWNEFNRLRKVPQINIAPATSNPDTPQWVDASEKNLRALHGHGGDYQFRYEASRGKQRLTHFEIIYYLTPPVHAALQEINMPYDSEFLDDNTTMTMELSGGIEVDEGDIISEEKYGRVWRATSLTERATSKGRSFGSSVDCRNIQSGEVYFNMNVYKPEDAPKKQFQGRRENYQGGK